MNTYEPPKGPGRGLWPSSGTPQAEFAAALGTSAPRFSTYRSGRTKPTAVFCFRARRIARALAAARASRPMSAPVTARAVRDATAVTTTADE